MTVIGKDRPGLVESLASLLLQHGGNWRESRMCRLGGEFAGILRVHVPAQQEQSFFQTLQGLQAHGLSVVVHPDRAEALPAHRKLAQIELVGQDRPGIVRQISSVLARQGINVEELTTECRSAPMSGETLFTAHARLLIPEDCNMAALRQELEKIAADLMVDLSLQEVPTE